MKYSISCQKAGVIVEVEGKKLAALSYDDVQKGDVYQKLLEFGVPKNEIALPGYFRRLEKPFVGKLMVNTKTKTSLDTYAISREVEANRIIVETNGKIMTLPYLEGLSVRHAIYEFLSQYGILWEDTIAPEISMLPKKLTVITQAKTNLG